MNTMNTIDTDTDTDTNTADPTETKRHTSTAFMTLKYFWRVIAPAFLERVNELTQRDNRRLVQISQLTQNVELLNATCSSLQSQIECMEVRESYEKRSVEAQEETAANLKSLNESVKTAGTKGMLSTLVGHGAASPAQKDHLSELWAETL